MTRLPLLALLLVAACSSSSPHSAAPSTTSDSAAAYVSAVNALCDQLQTDITSHPGSYPVAVYFRELPAHTRLQRRFDAAVAALPVPPAAVPASRALAAYVALADDIDRRRLAAARHGQAAFDRELARIVGSFYADPVVRARTAAGFSSSCDAR